MLAATLYQENPDRNYKLWNILSTERYILHMQVLLELSIEWLYLVGFIPSRATNHVFRLRILPRKYVFTKTKIFVSNFRIPLSRKHIINHFQLVFKNIKVQSSP
jgi:hypothetical protein